MRLQLAVHARALTGAPAFVEIERAVRTLLAERFGVPTRASVDEVDAALALAVPEVLRDRTRAVLAACARGQFAPGLGDPPGVVADEAEATLGALDAVAPDVARARRRREPVTA